MSESSIPQEQINRFWSKVRISGQQECWEWQGGIGHNGYGLCRINGRTIRVHRFAYTVTYGPIPDGMNVCHACDNRKCVNPAHLWLGTQAENIKDCIQKGRQPHPKGIGNPRLVSPGVGFGSGVGFGTGPDNANNVLSAEQVAEIRSRYASGGVSHEDLAQQYGVARTHIGRIVRRQVWKWLE